MFRRVWLDSDLFPRWLYMFCMKIGRRGSEGLRAEECLNEKNLDLYERDRRTWFLLEESRRGP